MLDSIERATRDRDLTIDGQKRFIADASHELRSPLTSILANAGFLIERPDAEPSDRLDATTDIRSEAKRMSDLIDRLLMLARADVDGRAALEVAPVDLAGLIGSVERRARNLDIAIETHLEAGVVVLADATALAEVVWILIDNADRHGGERVSIATTSEGQLATVVVHDDGDGLPDGAAERVFERFHRADPSRTGKGHGLGLAIARSIIDSHEGSIKAANGADGGALFTFTVPLA
jgi:signal transduction histidine kinase